jgi:hypothetical protein
MPLKPDPTSDFSLTDLNVDKQGTTTAEVDDDSESGSRSVSARQRDKAPIATDDHGSFLLRDSFKIQGGSQ